MSKHICSGFAIFCMDFRIQKAVDSLFASLKVDLGNVDRVAVAGGAGNTGLLFYHLDLSQKLHEPETFILVGHDDCGYGATKDDLLKSLMRVRQELPQNDTVRGFWIYQHDSGDWTSEEVFVS